LSRLWHFYALLLQHFPLETTVAIPPKKMGHEQQRQQQQQQQQQRQRQQRQITGS